MKHIYISYITYVCYLDKHINIYVYKAAKGNMKMKKIIELYIQLKNSAAILKRNLHWFYINTKLSMKNITK